MNCRNVHLKQFAEINVILNKRLEIIHARYVTRFYDVIALHPCSGCISEHVLHISM